MQEQQPAQPPDPTGAAERTENAAKAAGETQRMAAVRDYMNGKARVQMERLADTTPHGWMVLNYFGRAMGMANSLSRLDHPLDYQLVMAGVRTLFEMAVDLTLINSGKDTLEKLELWEHSALLEHAHALKRRHEEKPSFPLASELTGFLARASPILEGRELHWRRPAPKQAPPAPSGPCERCKREHEARGQRAAKRAAEPTEHPDRWTNRTLYQDALEADNAPGAGDLVDFYVTMNRMLCWGTHGSGAVGVRNITTAGFPTMHWTAMAMAVDVALRVTQLCLEHFKVADVQAEDAAKADGQRRYEHAYNARIAKGPDRAP
ncbi:MAG: hypothetical protein RLZZ450_3391 [Pseudomonadota bacterium]|jgi:hypothetical protein